MKNMIFFIFFLSIVNINFVYADTIEKLNEKLNQLKIKQAKKQQNFQYCKQSLSNSKCQTNLLSPELYNSLKKLEQSQNELKLFQKKMQSFANKQNKSIKSNNSEGNCYSSSITSPSPFMGNSGEVFVLSDNSVWEIFGEFEYLYEYSPSITACPNLGFIIVNEKKLTASLLSSSCYQSYITNPSPFMGNGGEVFTLSDGSVWQDSSYLYLYLYEYSPSVLICEDNGMMILDGNKFSVSKIK